MKDTLKEDETYGAVIAWKQHLANFEDSKNGLPRRINPINTSDEISTVK